MTIQLKNRALTVPPQLERQAKIVVQLHGAKEVGQMDLQAFFQAIHRVGQREIRN